MLFQRRTSDGNKNEKFSFIEIEIAYIKIIHCVFME